MEWLESPEQKRKKRNGVILALVLLILFWAGSLLIRRSGVITGQMRCYFDSAGTRGADRCGRKHGKVSRKRRRGSDVSEKRCIPCFFSSIKAEMGKCIMHNAVIEFRKKSIRDDAVQLIQRMAVWIMNCYNCMPGTVNWVPEESWNRWCKDSCMQVLTTFRTAVFLGQK